MFDYNPYDEVIELGAPKPAYYNKFAGFFYGVYAPVFLTNCRAKPKEWDFMTTKTPTRNNVLVYAGFFGSVYNGESQMTDCSFDGILTGRGCVGAIAAFLNNSNT